MASPMLHPARTSANQCTPSKSRLNPIRMGKQAVINRIVILPLLIFSMESVVSKQVDKDEEKLLTYSVFGTTNQKVVEQF